ncbi:MAG: flagellar biosynthetic protein FliQ [Rubellimicrobium sp.]|nr:flagellar biosynthetic protein FliQ [Rubellimicrobium sp.]
MSETVFYDVMRQGLWTSLVISIPILGVALIAGLVVGLLQALTSIQEMTLTFVPKLSAIVLVFWMTMGFMTTSLTAFFQDRLIPLIAGV